jgi:exopolysaccharide biosynthesis polyprenyl glycosylphosphotransferase
MQKASIENKTKERQNANPFHNWNKESEMRSLNTIRVSLFKPSLKGVQLLIDAITVVLSFELGFSMWNQVAEHVPSWYAVPFSTSLHSFSIAVALCSTLIGFIANGLYNPVRSLLNVRELEGILKALLISCTLSLMILFLSREPLTPRGPFAATWVSMFLLMVIQRYVFFRLQLFLNKSGKIKNNVLIYGAGEVGEKLVEKLQQSPRLGYRVVGFLDDNPSLHGKESKGLPVFGGFGVFRRALSTTGCVKIFICTNSLSQARVNEILEICKAQKCQLQIVPSLYDIVIQRVKLSEVDGIPLIGLSEPRYSFRTMIAKRIFDFITACLLSILLSPVLISLALLVRLSSKGPILFRQNRVGKNGKEFLFYKFRSMYVEAPVYATTPGSGKDSRITPIGRFLRRSSLDELPQLWNVIKGDMSLVGPRPEMPFIVEQYNEMQRQRLNVRPGITGLWQISKDRKLAIHENMDYDIYYINNQSFLLDLVILGKTATSVVVGAGAY